MIYRCTSTSSTRPPPWYHDRSLVQLYLVQLYLSRFAHDPTDKLSVRFGIESKLFDPSERPNPNQKECAPGTFWEPPSSRPITAQYTNRTSPPTELKVLYTSKVLKLSSK